MYFQNKLRNWKEKYQIYSVKKIDVSSQWKTIKKQQEQARLILIQVTKCDSVFEYLRNSKRPTMKQNKTSVFI